MNELKRLAKILSYLLSPPMFAFYVILIIVLNPPLEIYTNIVISLLISIIFLCVFPVIAILYFKQKGSIDIWVSNQQQRTPFYIIALVGYVFASTIFYFREETTLFALSVAYFAVTVTITLSNFSTKVSSHSAGVAGPLTALTMIYGLVIIPAFFILPIVYWSRLKLSAHTLSQLVFGTIIGIMVTFFIFFLLYPI